MKRFLARMSALVTVVVLGLMAIAQAQRSVQAPPPNAEASGRAPSGSGLASSEFPARDPMESTASPAGRPRLFPGGPGINPLRDAGGAGFSERVVATSGESGGQDYTTSNGTGPTRGYPTTSDEISPTRGYPSIPPADPFALSTEDSNGAQSGQIERIDGSPEELLRQTPTDVTSAERGESRAAGPMPLAESAPSAPGARHDRMPAGSLPTDRYSGPAISAPGLAEPDRFQPDAGTSVSGMPSGNGDSLGRLSRSSAESALRDVGPLGDGTGTPGSRQIEGIQTPQLTVQKIAPQEIQVGKAVTFQVVVSNIGPVVAHNVEIRDEVPKGTRLIGTSPQASRGTRGELVWALGSLRPGEDTSVEVQLMPVDEGEIGSVASVHFSAEASVRTIATKPELVLHTSAPKQVLIGQEVTLSITVSNPGSGVATGVVLEEHVPPGLQHAADNELEYDVGDLAPNESRQLELTLVAVRPGPVTNVLAARAEADLRTENRLDIEVLAPQLDVTLEGPKRRYLERQATYTLSVSNPGTAPARNVELVAYLPEGLEFAGANNAGQYEAATRTVHWVLEELPVRETGDVRLTAVPVEAGEKRLRFAGTAESGLAVEGEQMVRVEGIAAILFQVVDVDDPIELGGETTYEIRVVNQGSKAATNVQLVVQLPDEMRPVAAEGPSRHTMERNRIVFEGLPRLAPKADTTYRVRVQGLQPGDLRLRVQLLTDEMSTWVTKEESTRVYSDE
jgi:uncharacterized repeat protein (TIGR01451 family)